MTDFTQGENRYQSPLFTERLDDYIAEVSAMCLVDVFIDDLDLSGLGFEGKTIEPECQHFDNCRLLDLQQLTRQPRSLIGRS